MASLIGAVIRASRPQFRNGHDRVAFAAHAFVLGKGLKLLSVGAAADLAATSEAAATGQEEEVGIDGWQDLPETYVFRYAGEAAGGPVLSVKCLAAGEQLLLHAAAGTEAPVTAELSVASYTNTASDDLLKGFSDLDGLAAVLESSLGPTIDKVLKWEPSNKQASTASNQQQKQQGEQTEAATDASSSGSRGGEGGPNRQPPPAPERDHDPLRDDRFHDPLRVGPPRMPGMVGVGADDLLPGGLPRPGGHGGGRLVDPSMMMGGGGMHMGPGNPMFGGGMQHPGMMGDGGVGAGIPMHPAGARWDPIGPPGMQGFHPDDFSRDMMGRGGRRGPNIHPDIGPPPGMGGFQDHMFG